jgi:hypothetical protein
MAVVKDRLLDLHLDQLALFLDDDDQIQGSDHSWKGLHVHREGLPDLVGRDAQPVGLGLVDAQQRKGMDQIQPVLAGGDKARRSTSTPARSRSCSTTSSRSITPRTSTA